MLIRRAELQSGALTDVRVEAGVVSAIGEMSPLAGEEVLDAQGGLLLPGLHDHHIHVAALAASLSSVRCGPPEVTTRAAFAASLQIQGTGWLRAIGYHETVAGMLDAATLDRIVSHRPVRVQHRSGRMWFLNSLALERVLADHAPPPGLERANGRFTGRLFDADRWLQAALASEPPSFAPVGTMLARVGVTGLTDMSPANDAFMARHFAAEQERASLPQRVLLAGTLALGDARLGESVHVGPAKLHLHEADLPALDEATAFVRAAHAQQRNVAVHCATEVELLFTLAAFHEAGSMPGDRIEHAAVAPDFAVSAIAERELAVVSQPHFIHERGDIYLQEVEANSRDHLYRLRAFVAAGVTLAAGSDAPFGGTDPWRAMAAAVSRATRAGACIGRTEALTPEEALALYLGDPRALERLRQIRVGVAADLCLLDRPWREVREDLSARSVRATIIGGRRVFDRIDQPPA